MSTTSRHFKVAPRSLSEALFVSTYGGIYEHSPWIAQATYKRGLGAETDTTSGLAAALALTLDGADKAQLLALIRAHPDLAGKAAQQGQLTEDSTQEQAGAGIDQCTPGEFQRFQRYNKAYQERFEFPFVMAVKGSDRHAILQAFEHRLKNDAETEFQRALHEINKIARLRLDALAQD